MSYSEFGHPSGQPVFYFHGTPGSAEECALFSASAKKHGLRFICIDRFSLEKDLCGADYYEAIAERIRMLVADKSIAFVGFSIGSHVAMRVSVLMGAQVRCVHLISAVAPLESGDYVPDMAGGAVFKLARDSPRTFKLLSSAQSLLCRVAPRLLFSMIFDKAKGEDKAMAQDAAFQSLMGRVLQRSYVEQLSGYKRDVSQYVQPWCNLLAQCLVQTYLWHGSEDNWSPVEMSKRLADELPNCAGLSVVEGASHYSCMQRSVDDICMKLQQRQG